MCEHAAIVDAIASGDAVLAATLMEQHVDEIDYWVRDGEEDPVATR